MTQNTKLSAVLENGVTLLEYLVKKLERFDDEGPPGESWKSDELEKALVAGRELLAKLKQSPRPHIDEDERQDAEDEAFLRGEKAAWLQLIRLAAKNLGYDHPEVQKVAWIEERVRAINALRDTCAEHGDNDWDDDLHLADIIDKHLGRHLGQ